VQHVPLRVLLWSALLRLVGQREPSRLVLLR
jgi:hypothetical protein